MTRTAPVWLYAEVNPATPEFKTLDDGTEVSFMPLEAVWPGGKGDYTNTLPWSSKQSYSQFRRGDILVPKITPTFEAGRTIIAEIPFALGLASTEVHVGRPNASSDPRFLQYCFQSLPFLDEGAHSLQGVGNLRRITPRFVQEHKVLDATLDTQRAIADYLDRETGEIDAMIAKMDELAETLEMRRGRAVDVLLDDLPTSTERIPSKYVVKIRTGSGDTKDAVEHGEYPFYVRSQTPKSHDRWEFDGDAVLTAGDGAGVGKVFHFVTGKFMAHQRVYVINDFDGVVPKYYFHLFKHLFPRVATDGSAKATVDSVRHRMIADLRIPFPAPTEQRRIADHLDEVTGKIDAMLAKVAELKSLLIERRAALITEVVTGRKKVA